MEISKYTCQNLNMGVSSSHAKYLSGNVKPWCHFITVILCLTTSFLCFCTVVAANVDTIVKREPPGLKSPNKVWWAKEITPDFHIAGRLTERQIKYASEAGFGSILSLFMYETDDYGSFGGEYLPTTAEAWVAAHKAGLQYVALIGANDDWAAPDTVEKFSSFLPKLRRPILLHCDRGYTIAFVTLMYMANQTRYNSSFEPKIRSDEFYKATAAMGLDFTHDDLKEIVANITGEEVIENPPKHNCEPQEWLDFWLAHPVSKNWYVSGQIRKCDVKALESFGFKAVVNMRLGLTDNDKPSQEPVPLLNIKDGSTTYGNASTPPRQDLTTLENNKINGHHSSDYISEKSKINYEIENPLEFGDDIGYNEELEKDLVQKSALKYYHIPILTKLRFSKTEETNDFDKLESIIRTHAPKVADSSKQVDKLIEQSPAVSTYSVEKSQIQTASFELRSKTEGCSEKVCRPKVDAKKYYVYKSEDNQSKSFSGQSFIAFDEGPPCPIVETVKGERVQKRTRERENMNSFGIRPSLAGMFTSNNSSATLTDGNKNGNSKKRKQMESENNIESGYKRINVMKMQKNVQKNKKIKKKKKK